MSLKPSKQIIDRFDVLIHNVADFDISKEKPNTKFEMAAQINKEMTKSGLTM